MSSDLRQSLDRCDDFASVFVLVRKTVKNTLGKRRTGLMLGLADLPEYIGAFHALGTNFIVMNRSILDDVTKTTGDRKLVNSYVFYTLLHEYLHSLGYVDEMEVRRRTYELCRDTLGPDHPTTVLAREGPSSVFPGIFFQHHGRIRRRRMPRFEIVKGFEKETRYVA